MDFKIRPDGDKNPKSYMSYLANLKAKANSMPSALIEYFAIDFFSDGEIKNFSFSNDMKTFSFEVSSPNIIKLNGKKDFSYVSPVWFKFIFEKVSYFFLESIKVDDLNDPFARKEKTVIFEASELNGYKKEIARAEKNHGGKFYSLTIKTCPGDRSLALVFSDILVEAKKPLLLSKLKKSKSVRFPKLTTAIKGDAYKL